MNFPALDHFFPAEFPERVGELVNYSLLYALDGLREKYGRPIHPSPLAAGWYRFNKSSATSRHFAVDRFSDAGDVFPEGHILDLLELAKAMPVFGGIGIYVDTKFRNKAWPMMHLDMRPYRRLWARVDGQYIYPHRGGVSREKYYMALLEASKREAMVA